MKFRTLRILCSLAFLAVSPLIFGQNPSETAGNSVSKLQIHKPQDLKRGGASSARFIVAVEAKNLLTGDVVAQLRREYDLDIVKVWPVALPGFLVEIDLATAERLAADPRVRFVEQDVEIEAPPTPSAEHSRAQGAGGGTPECFFDQGEFVLAPYPSSTSTIQWIPEKCPDNPTCTGNWGIDRIDDRVGLDGTYQPQTGSHPVDVFLIDTGVALGHEELAGLVNEVQIGPGPFGPTYHGSHLAGIVAGQNFGVARSPIRLTSVSLGSGVSVPLSRIIEAFEYVLDQKSSSIPAVASLSFNHSSFPSSMGLSQVVRNLIIADVLVINSAGNLRYVEPSSPFECDDIYSADQHADNFAMIGTRYPPEVLIVGASSDSDQVYCECGDREFSSYDCASRVGAIDFFAPGVNIVSMSAQDDQAICHLSGTSMAVPHAAGAAALLLSRFPHASPGAIQEGLKRMSTKNVIRDHQGNVVPGGRLLFVGTDFTSERPVAGHQYVTAEPGQTLIFPMHKLLAGDFDWEGRPLRVADVGKTWNGKVANLTLAVKFTVDADVPPSTDVHSSAGFSYSITNGIASSSARVRVIVLEPGLPALSQ